MRSERLTLRTPEGVVFALPLAGPIPRFLAWLIDLGCILAATSLISGISTPFSSFSFDLAVALQLLLGFVVSLGYAIVTEWRWRGQTIGKRFLHLRVVDERGGKLRLAQVVLRNLLRAVDILPVAYLVGGAAMLLSRRLQRLGDFAAGTVVIRIESTSPPELGRSLRVKYNSLRQHGHLASRLRQRLTAEEAMLGLRALVRVESLDPQARMDLFARLADHYRSIVPFPDEAVENLADEQYVRNVVDIVFRPDGERSPEPVSRPVSPPTP